MTRLLAGVAAVGVRLHVPDDLMAEELRNLRGFEDEALRVSYRSTRRQCRTQKTKRIMLTERISAKSLDDLRDVKEGDADRVVLEDA